MWMRIVWSRNLVPLLLRVRTSKGICLDLPCWLRSVLKRRSFITKTSVNFPLVLPLAWLPYRWSHKNLAAVEILKVYVGAKLISPSWVQAIWSDSTQIVFTRRAILPWSVCLNITSSYFPQTFVPSHRFSFCTSWCLFSFHFIHSACSGLHLFRLCRNSWSYALLCLLSLYLKSSSRFIGCLSVGY